MHDLKHCLALRNDHPFKTKKATKSYLLQTNKMIK